MVDADSDNVTTTGPQWSVASADGRWHFVAPSPAAALDPAAAAPTFSVVIAAWQAAGVIGEAIASALAQTHPCLEILVSDDGSTDDLPAALAPFEDRVTLLRLDHRGEAAAKNAGARAASGDFVVYLDADDVFDAERLEALAALAVARPDLDILTTDAFLEVGGEVVRRCYTPNHRFEVVDQRRAILQRNFVFGLAAARRSRLIEAGGFDEDVERTSDWGCWIRMILTGSAVGLVEAPLARYRVRRESLSSDRLGMAQGGLSTLEHAAQHPALTAGDRATLTSAMAAQRRRLRMLAARTAVRDGWPDVRGRCLAVARSGEHPGATRVKLLLVAALPPAAIRWLGRREARRWTGAGGTVVDD